MTSRQFKERLAQRAHRADVAIAPILADRLEVYFRLLATWNAKINLTALPLADPPPETFDRLLIEPLAAAKHVDRDAERVIDVGSGGGSPAIPLALAVPRLQLLMVESRTRKSVFLLEAVRALGLAGAEVAAVRFEELSTRPDLARAHDLATIRAIRLDSELVRAIARFLKPNGQLFLFGGPGGPTGSPGLRVHGEYPLLKAEGSRLLVLKKAECST